MDDVGEPLRCKECLDAECEHMKGGIKMNITIYPKVEIEVEFERCHECRFWGKEIDPKRPDAPDVCLLFGVDLYHGLRCDECHWAERGG